MKKLVLGLLLTLGISSCFHSNTLEEKNKINDDVVYRLGGCYVVTVVNCENACGEYMYSVSSPKRNVNCGAGQADGTTTTYYEVRHESGWNMGTQPGAEFTTCP